MKYNKKVQEIHSISWRHESAKKSTMKEILQLINEIQFCAKNDNWNGRIRSKCFEVVPLILILQPLGQV